MKVSAPKGYHWMKQPKGGYKLMKHTGKFKPHKGASLTANFDVQKVQDMCGEDVSFCLDAIEAGYEIWCDPRIRVGHEKTRVI